MVYPSLKLEIWGTTAGESRASNTSRVSLNRSVINILWRKLKWTQKAGRWQMRRESDARWLWRYKLRYCKIPRREGKREGVKEASCDVHVTNFAHRPPHVIEPNNICAYIPAFHLQCCQRPVWGERSQTSRRSAWFPRNGGRHLINSVRF